MRLLRFKGEEYAVYTIIHRSGAHVNQHQPLVHVLSRIFRRMLIRHQIKKAVAPAPD